MADLLSKPTQIGYMTGLALTILVGQLPKLFGFSIHSDTLIGDITGFVDGVRSGKTVTAAVLIGLFGLAVILVLQRWLPKVPGVLVAVVLSIGAAVVFDLGRPRSLPRGHPTSGAAAVHHPECVGVGLRAARRRGPRDLARGSDGHHLDGIGIRCPQRGRGSGQPGDDRHRHVERGRRALPGVPRQHQRLADRGG